MSSDLDWIPTARVGKGVVTLACVLGFLLTGLVCAQPAGAAGTYEVVACDAAGGANRSWRPQPGNPSLFVSRQRCPALGTYDGFGMRSTTLGLNSGQLSGSWWRFDPPAGTTLQAIDWAGHYATSSPGWVARLESSRGVVAGCGPSARRCERQWAHGAKPAHYDLGGAGWIRVGAACLAATGCRTGDGRTTPYVDASTWFARVIVRDPEGPTISVGGSPVERSWVAPGEAVRVAATDASGISRINFSLDRFDVDSKGFDCDRTLPRPCVDRSAEFAIPDEATDGQRHFAVSAFDAAGNEARSELVIGVDGLAPRAPSAPTIDGGAGWRATRGFTVRWELPDQGEGAPIARSLLSVCRQPDADGGQDCLPLQSVPAGSSMATVELPSQGQWEARVYLEDAAGNRDPRNPSPAALLRWDSTPPGPGRIVVPERWIGRDAARALSLRMEMAPEDAGQASGVAGWAFAIGSVPGTAVELEGGLASVPLGGFPEGVTEVSARAISGAGIASRSVATARVRIDETPPNLDLEDPAGGGWSRHPFVIIARGRDQSNLSGMSTSEGGSAAVRIGLDGGPLSAIPGDEARLAIDEDGVHTVVAEAIDAAGNSSGRRSLTVRVDSTPPERFSFLPQDSADPRIVRVDALDLGSGIEAVRLRMRPVAGGDWVDLAGSLDGERFEAILDETKLREGLWELEASATDRAGNERRTTRTIAGDPAVVAIPLRSPTRVDATIARASSGSGGSGAGISVANGDSAEIGGRLLDSYEQPIGGAMLTLSSAPMVSGGSWSSGGFAVTDRLGRFRFTVPPGPSRRVRIAFAGDHRGMPSTLDFALRVGARTTLGVTPRVVRVGSVALFSGRLSGGWIPSVGKLVLVQALIPRHGWQTFAVARANTAGEWSARYRFRASVGRMGYSIRALVPTEAAYPFEGFTADPIRVVAVG